MYRNFGIILFAGFMVASFSQAGFSQDKIEADMLKFWGPVPDEISGGVESMTAAQIEQANENLSNAVDPMLDMFGFLSGGGLYNTADVHGVLGFDVGIKMTAMQVGDDQTPSLTSMPSGLESGPLGEESLIPLPLIHVGLGLAGNLEVFGRYFTMPMGKAGETEGNVTLVGGGVKFGLLQVFGLPKVAVIGAYHRMSVPEEFKMSSVSNASAMVVASYSLPALATIYGGAGVDYTNFKIEFEDPVPDPDPFSKSNLRANVGVKFNPIPLVPLYVNVDYNFGAVKGFSAGLGVSLR